MNELAEWRKRFAQPPASARSVPFWAWNDKLEPEELRRQIVDMREKGIGGFFMHSRDGLETPYMGDAWMDAVRTAADLAEELGMQAWLYDEDRWPSGSAGGSVPAQGDAFRSKGLTLEIADDVDETDERIIAVFAAELDGLALRSCRRLPVKDGQGSGMRISVAVDEPSKSDDAAAQPAGVSSEAGASSGEKLLVFRVEVSAGSEWFNDESPPDSLNPATVRAFIEATHEVYKAGLGDRLGRSVVGVFTDEPGIHDRNSRYTPGRGWLPWTYAFPDYFAAKRGYDILEVIAYVFFDGEPSSAARHDYWRTIAELFCESFSRQLGEWCEANGLLFTGHYLWEGSLGVATRVGGAVMPHYRYQHVPGIDLLNEQTDEVLTVKQCTSVASQYGRQHVLTETYGCTGWGFTFEGMKWIGDWQYVLGVTLRSQHLALYSLKGCRKRDYPPVFNYQTTWWEDARLIEDYFARITAVMSEGSAVRDVLVLHPASTAWSLLGTGPYASKRRGEDRNIPEIDQYGNDFNDFLRALLAAHYDFDLGDETIMAEEGAAAERRLRIRLASYDTVIVPEIRTMLRSTCELLRAFVDGGGRLIAVGEAPALIEGRVSDEAAALYARPGVMRAASPAHAIALLAGAKPRTVSLRGADGEEQPELLYLLKVWGGGHSLFVVNNDRNRSFDVTLEIQATGRIEAWDPLTGTVSPLEAETEDGRLRLRASFGPADSKLYMIYDGEAENGEGEHGAHGEAAGSGQAEPLSAARKAEAREKTAKVDAASPACGAREERFGPAFRFTRTAPNVLTLDQCVYRLGDADWSGTPVEIWAAQRDIRAALGMRQVYYNGITQRYKWVDQPHPQDGTPVGFRLSFTVDRLPTTPVQLVLEGSDRFRLRLNGQEAPARSAGWFVDRAMDRVPLPGSALRLGPNELELTCAYTEAMEMEDVFLIGDFGVSPLRELTAEPSLLQAGDWCPQGYYHYNGGIVYHLDDVPPVAAGERATLFLGEFAAVTAKVRVNGVIAGYVPWKAADGIELTPWLRERGNAIELELTGSPRNMFGPFHDKDKYPHTTDWSSFRKEGDDFTPDYVVHPYGLFGPVRIVREPGDGDKPAR